MNSKTIHTLKTCQTAFDKGVEEINRCIVKAQRLNEKMQQYMQTITESDDDQVMLYEFVNECQDAIIFNVLRANELSESLGVNYLDIASTTIDNASKCFGHIINCNIEKMKARAVMAMTA